MNLKYVLSATALMMLGACSVQNEVPKQQKIIFSVNELICEANDNRGCAQALNDPRAQNKCNEMSEDVSLYMKDGWRVVTQVNKRQFGIQLSNLLFTSNIWCVGTEYIIEK